MLKLHDKASLDTKVLDKNNNETTLKSFLDKYLVVYFYPKDNTPGCTVEACEFRDYNDKIKELGASIVGISKDSVASHNKFSKKHNLRFPLLSDQNLALHKEFGAFGEKKMFGKKYMGTIRSTFILNSEGEVIKVWTKVKVKNHAEEVYEYLKHLTTDAK
jgi:peroxiredoxin Q/BCP